MLKTSETNYQPLPSEYNAQMPNREEGSANDAHEAFLMLWDMHSQELATHRGEAAIVLAAQKPESDMPESTNGLPAGFRSMEIVENGLLIPAKQFEGRIYSFKDKAATNYKADVQKLVTDAGVRVNVADLRPLMTSQVLKGGPTVKSLKEDLDEDFYRDVKIFAESRSKNLDQASPGGKKLVGVSGVRYSGGKSLCRAYWMLVTGDKTMTIARIADNDNSIPSQQDLYRRVYHKEMPKK